MKQSTRRWDFIVLVTAVLTIGGCSHLQSGSGGATTPDVPGANGSFADQQISCNGVTQMTDIKRPSEEDGNRKTVVAFYEAGLNKKDFDAARGYLGAHYKQHNPNAADGIEGFREFVAYMKDKTPDSHSEIVQVFADRDYVILHVRKTVHPGDRGIAIVDIFRLENGKIVEHWDVSQQMPERTVSGNSMF